MKKLSIYILFLLVFQITFAQENARNGYIFPPRGEIRFFLVFADVRNDTSTANIPNWNAGELPRYADEIIDDNFLDGISSHISRFFDEASFGSLTVIGDYYPDLIEFDTSEIYYDGYCEVVRYLNNLPGDDIMTKHGHLLKDFDNWSINSSQYQADAIGPDHEMDMLVIVWRHNSKYRKKRDGGSCSLGDNLHGIKNLTGVTEYIIIYSDNPSEVLRHEFAHCIIGANNFHSGGAGAGNGHFLSDVGGYSTLSSHNHNLISCNGWDRWWLGWKNSNNDSIISARDLNGNEVNTNLVYGESLSTNDFVLRDFSTTGDAIRIRLPYLKTLTSKTKEQYLWIENHQINPESIEYSLNRPKGIRFNIQIGNDTLTKNYNYSRTNYLVPLSAFGNYDFSYDSVQYVNNGLTQIRYLAHTYDSMANPFSGYHPAMLPALDLNNDDSIRPTEFIPIWNTFLNDTLTTNNFPVYGTDQDAFPEGFILNMSSNPPSTPLLTYITGNRGFSPIIYSSPSNDDNRHIWLNGLHIEIVEKYTNGDIHIKIRWNDYKINNDVRWCDSIMLKENIELQSFRTLTLDYGLTPTRPHSPIPFNGTKVFNPPTVLTCCAGSYFKQESLSTVNVKNSSTLVLEAGSMYEVGDGAVLNIEPTAVLHVKSGATLKVAGTGHVEIQNGAYICIEDGANLQLVDQLSSLNLRTGYITGTPSQQSNCTSTPLPSFTLTNGSNGNIHTFLGNGYIQRRTYTGNAYEAWNKIYAGNHVVLFARSGDVVLENGSHVILDAEGPVRLEPGFKVNQGAVLEVR